MFMTIILIILFLIGVIYTAGVLIGASMIIIHAIVQLVRIKVLKHNIGSE